MDAEWPLDLKHPNLSTILRLGFVINMRASAAVGGGAASWLVCSSPVRAVRVQALNEDIVLCPWARHLKPHSASLHPSV